MDFLPIIFALAGLWNLFLLGKNLHRDYAIIYFQRVDRTNHPLLFWTFSSLLAIAGLMLIGGAMWIGNL